MLLKDKTAVLTGSNRGIGKEYNDLIVISLDTTSSVVLDSLKKHILRNILMKIF